MKIGLCLSGGGVKGAAHIGVIKALEEENIKISFLSGTSSGSIVATLYSVGYTTQEILEIFKKYGKNINYIDIKTLLKSSLGIIFKRQFIPEGLNSGIKIEQIINKACADKNILKISDIKIPIIIPSVNVYNGEIYLFTSYETRQTVSSKYIPVSNIEIGKAVRASCSYPGIFAPVKYEDKFLIDGGIRENFPWKELRNIGAEKIICIKFENKLKKEKKNINILDVVSGALELMSFELAKYESCGADYIVNIISEKVNLLDKSKIEFFYELGYLITKRDINKIKEKLIE